MIEYNSKLNNLFGCTVVQSQTQIQAKISHEKRFSLRSCGKIYELNVICPCCGSISVTHNGNDKCKSKLVQELGLVIKKGKFKCKKCGKTWTTRYEDAELFIREFKQLIKATIFQLCSIDVSLENTSEYILNTFSKKISHEWIRQIYLETTKIIESKNILHTSGIFNYDEQHLKVNGKEFFRVVVIDAITKKVLFDERVENKKIDVLKDKLRLKMLPYKKEVFIVDLALGYPKMLKELFPDIKVQWCIFHLNQLILRDFEHSKKLNAYGKKILPLQESYNQYLLFNLFMNHKAECNFLKRQVRKLTARKEQLKGCGVNQNTTTTISRYEMKLIYEFIEYRKCLRKHRRKYKHNYLLKNNKKETLMQLKKLEKDIKLFPDKLQKRIKSIRKNLDKLSLFQENSLVPATNNNVEQYYSATLQKTNKKKFRNNESLDLKLKIVREKWNKTLGKIKFNFFEFLQLFAKLHFLFHPT